MPSPFYNAIKASGCTGAPTTGAYTPNGTASAGYRSWSGKVPAGWIGLVRYEEGSLWELTYSYWNGTTLSRAASQVLDSSAGGFGVQVTTFTTAATAELVADAMEVQSHLGTIPWRGAMSNLGGTTLLAFGVTAPTVLGTASSVTLANTSLLEQQPAIIFTSATTANAQAGVHLNAGTFVYSSTSGLGGFDYTARFGATQIPTGPRLFIGGSTLTWGATTGDPTALAASLFGFIKDSADTNIQLASKDGTTASKVDTGMVWTANGLYEAALWTEMGGGTLYGLLVRLDTGAIWLGSKTNNLPANGSVLRPQVAGGLSSTTGTALVFRTPGFMVRYGA